jgi:hypothetical protein
MQMPMLSTTDILPISSDYRSNVRRAPDEGRPRGSP